MKTLLFLILTLPFLCGGCNEDQTAQLITDGSEAATVAAMLTVQTTLPTEAPLIKAALSKACTEAISILQDTASATTLQQVLQLSFSQDPLLSKMQPVVNFVLPILDDVPGITTALNTPISGLLSETNTFAQAFFLGIQTGLGDPEGTTVAQIMAKNPKLAKALKKLGISKFDPGALINNLQAAAAGKPPVSVPNLLKPQTEVRIIECKKCGQ